MYAIFKTGGKQLKGEVGDKLFVEKLNLKVGTPTIKGAKVVAKVVKEGKQKKVLVFRYKNKTNHDILRGHRQPYTLVEITSIEG